MKEDAIAVVHEPAEAAGISLDGLDLGVEASGDGVGDWLGEVVQQAEQMGFEREGGLQVACTGSGFNIFTLKAVRAPVDGARTGQVAHFTIFELCRR